MSSSPEFGTTASSHPRCSRHPDVVTYVTCQRCGQPTCPQCQRPAPVGVRCVACAGAAAVRIAPRTLAGARASGGPVLSYAIIGLCVAAYLAQLLVPGFTETFIYSPAIGQYQPWRMLSSAFLHGGELHLLFNMYALYVVGPVLEQALGRLRFVLLYLLCALGGSVGVLVAANYFDLFPRFGGVYGASGAVFGLFGATVIVLRKLRRSDSQILLVIALNIVIGFLVPGIAWQAHLGGLAVGAWLAVTFVLAPPRRRNFALWLGLATTVAALGALTVAAY